MPGGPRRLLIYADGREFGGSERFVLELVGGVDRDRFEPIVVVNELLAADPRLHASGVECVSVPVRSVEDARIIRLRQSRGRAPRSPEDVGVYRERRHWVHAGSAAIRYGQAVHNLGVLRRALRRLAPDVVHINNGNYPGAESARLLALAAGDRARIVHFVHGIPTPVRWPADVEAAFDARVEHATDIWVTGAHAATTALAAARSIPLEKIRTVYLGQQLGPVVGAAERDRARRALGLPSDALVVLALGALTRAKGHASLIAALRELSGAHCMLAGAGPEEASLRASADERVHFLGWRDDVADLLAAADAVVQPSIGMEQMPFAIKEAMACGLPVVGTAVGGVPELVVDGSTGFLVEPGDPAALADAIGRLADPALRRELGERARARIETYFRPSAAVASLQSIYDAVLVGGPATARCAPA